MTAERFNALVHGPLWHPISTVAAMRLTRALQVVLEAAGEVGDKALEDHCTARREMDKRNAAIF